jgi:hypothetical protein
VLHLLLSLELDHEELDGLLDLLEPGLLPLGV